LVFAVDKLPQDALSFGRRTFERYGEGIRTHDHTGRNQK
jgi:hypothetical protein